MNTMIDKEEVIKVAGFVLPPAMAVFSSFLMLKYDSPSNNKDIVHRLAAASFSAFTLGVFVCVYLYGNTEVFSIAGRMGLEFFNQSIVGVIVLVCSVVWFCGLFGWVVFSGIAKWIKKNGESVIERALNKATKNEEKSN